MLKNLQLLRAFAALFVVFRHYNLLDSKTGDFGVDIFFVISGFIISFTVEKNSEQFFLKRLLRIAPMYYLITLFVIAMWFLKPNVFHRTYIDIPSVIKSFLFIPYSRDPVVGLGYTLNYEMYFYLLVACFLKFTNTAKQALICTGFFIVFIFIINNMFLGQFVVLNFYSKDVVFEFIYGIILYFIYKNLNGRALLNNSLYYGLALCILSVVFMVYVGYPQVPLHYRAFLFGIPAFIICAFFVFSEGRIRTDSVYHYFYKLGNASYTMYLIHPFVIFGILRLIHPLFNFENTVLVIIEFVISMALVCLTSTLIYNKIELPMRRFFKDKFLPAQKVGVITAT